jgi:hypothetical protein
MRGKGRGRNFWLERARVFLFHCIVWNLLDLEPTNLIFLG